MHRDHADRATTLSQGGGTLDKHRAQVGRTALIELLRVSLERILRLLHTEVRRVCDQGRVASVLEDLAHVGSV